MLLSMAWRNVVRNLRRSAITISAIALGLATLLFLWGFADGAHNSMMRNLQEVVVGSIQVHSRGFFRYPTLEGALDDRELVQQTIESLGELRSTVRLSAYALAAGEENSEGLYLMGVVPETERLTTVLHKKVSQGRFLQTGDTKACVLGATTVSILGVGLNDEVVLLAKDRYGSLSAEQFSLVGIIESGEMGVDRGLAIVPLNTMQLMLGMEDRVSDIVIQLPSDQLEQVTSSLRASLDPERYEVLRWYDMYPVMKQWIELDTAFYFIFLTIVLLIVAAGIMNTILMSTLERVREFGVMMALGCSRLRLALMVAMESMLLGMVGIVFGTGLGIALVALFGRVGINLSSHMDTITRFYIDPVIRTEINLDHLLITVISVVVAALLASIVPALHAAQYEPAKTLHHV